MGFHPKSQIKKLQPGIDLLSGDFGGLESLVSNALSKLFRGALGLTGNGSSQDQIVSTNNPTPADVTLLQTRSLKVIAMKTDDFNSGNYTNTVILSNEVPIGGIEEEPDIKRHYSRPYLDDYQKGYYDRYIFYDTRTKEILEVREKDFIKYRDLRYKRATVISWYILGQKDDYQFEGFIYPGVENNNIDVLDQAEVITPGITEFFKAYKGFTEHLLEDISQYDGAVEVIDELYDPPPPPTDLEIEEEEDLTPTEQFAELPSPPDMGLLDALGDDLIDAADQLDAFDETIDDLVSDQDAITQELEDDLADQESRLQALEEEQERQERINAIKLIIDVDEMNLSQDLINWSSKARRKKKRRRLDQKYDEHNLGYKDGGGLIGIILNRNKHPEIYTAEEFVIAANESSLRARMKFNLVELGTRRVKIVVQWTRNRGDSYYNSGYKFKNGKIITGIHARLYSEGPSATSSGATGSTGNQNNYNNVTLNEEQTNAALGVLSPRERNQVPILRTKVIEFMKDEVLASQSEGGEFRMTVARNNVYTRYQNYKQANTGNTEWSKRNYQDTGSRDSLSVEGSGEVVGTNQNRSTRGSRKTTTPTKSGGGDRNRRMQENPSTASKPRNNRSGYSG